MARKSILIVGGGTAGWMSALVLHKKYDVHLIESKTVPTIGVGESTTETVMDALRQAGIDLNDFVNSCNATPKYGVLFDGWAKEKYFHPFGENFLENQYSPEECIDFLTKCYKSGRNVTQLTPYSHIAEKGIYPLFNSDEEFFNDVALHWQAGTVPEYLKNFLNGKIKHTYEDIKDVECNESGIQNVNEYTADYFIDCTGGKRVLSNALDIKWQSWTDKTPLDSVLTYSRPPESGIYYTRSTAWDNGWEWSIPLQDRMQHGYVYSSRHSTKEQSEQEIRRRRGNVEILRELKFEPGVLSKVAYKNMVSIGLSAHFIEPLEATNIELTVIMAKELDRAIEENDVDFADLNSRVLSYINEIKEFVIFHYSIPEKEGQFWKDIYQTYSNDDIIKRKQIYPWHPFNWYSVAQGINFNPEKDETVDVEIDYLTAEFNTQRKVAEIERMEG